MTDKSLILNKIKLHLNFNSDTEFAKFLGVKPQVLSNWRARNTFDTELIYTKCEDIDANWLLTGEGEMLKTPAKQEEPTQQVVDPQEAYNKVAHLEEKIAFLQRENQLLQENKALLEKENKRLTHEIDRLKNQKSPTSSIASSPQKSTGELPSITPKNTKNTSKSQPNMSKTL
ncbi:hypothetical protein EDM00_08420 [Ornithobacterium rhinotracheale]|uniref:helix-turn-helix domain-containing protein n=1 Tax=Ornithobacterium rhinotracheale TaxID=28251 RepID=UPI00129D12FC|nr:helix-turn-helix domain-containing protein [Ornithobacterium rhinotracheale]MRI64010.1 hypothetical protein [Ornithobacterium rhinotracheale]